MAGKRSDPIQNADDHAERRAARVEQITHIGSWEWTLGTDTVWWSDELYRIYGLEPRSCAITLESFLQRVHPEDRERTMREVTAATTRGGRFAYPERIVRPDGSIRELETIGEVSIDAAGQAVALIGTCRDVTEKARGDRFAAAEQQLLEAVVTGTPLPVILARIVTLIEDQSPGTIASILLLDADGTHLRHGAAPSLPASYNTAIDGAPIGPKAGSCGTAAYRKQPVYVVDIETDPLWEGWRDVVRPCGLRACWSSPFFSKEGRVLGTFALYYREPRGPSEDDLKLIARVTHFIGVAVGNRQLEDQLRALSEHVESIREDERGGLARELHDELGQGLTALKMDLVGLGRRATAADPASSAAIVEETRKMSNLADQILGQVRRISAELRPPVLDDLGLLPAIDWQAQEFERRTGVACAVRATLGEECVPAHMATAVFRIFQEALTNVTRHAEASRVEVSLECSGGWLDLEVADDGKGITQDALTSPRSLGLLGIRERAFRLSGTATIGPGRDRGTTLVLRLPLGAPVAVAR